MKGVIIRVDGTRETVDFTESTSYQTLRDAVGGLIQCVNLRSKHVDMWLHEEGKLIGLPQNPYATALWVEDYDYTDVMVGDVILTGGAGPGGETVGLSDGQVELFMNYDRTIYHLGMP